MEPAHKTLTLTIPNGVLKKNHNHQQQQQQQVRAAAAVSVYRECLKNHAASLGGHALDGCGEFMASPSSNPSDPTSLTCAACGCHRNFHRRLPLDPHRHPHPLSSEKQHNEEDDDDNHNHNEEEEDDGQIQDQDPDPDEVDGDPNDGETGENSSAPHMLLALSAGLNTQQPQSDIHRRIIEQQQQQQNGGNREAPPHPPPVPIPTMSNIINNNSRKRFRTKFSPEQKERMQDLSERLGWKMQKRDEGIVEERCREIGIGKGVFKVWMHNNKHNFLHSSSSSRSSNFTAAATIPLATDGVAPPISTLTPLPAAPMSDDSDGGNGNGNPIGISVRLNGSAVS